MDTGASSHMAFEYGNFPSLYPSYQTITVDNGESISSTHIGSTSIPTQTKTLSLHNVLIVTHIIKNLISVRRFTTDNFCSMNLIPMAFP